MSKIVAGVAIAAAFMRYGCPAYAQHSVNDRKAATSTVGCPAGSCGPRGGPRALKLDLCKPANCKK